MEQMLMWEKEHLGLYVSAHPLDSYKQVLSSYTEIIKLPGLAAGTQVILGGLISKFKRTLTKKNDPMAFFTLQDLSGDIEVLVFPKLMAVAVPYLDLDRSNSNNIAVHFEKFVAHAILCNQTRQIIFHFFCST
jgi:DNA polymerase III alpha subunit